jgi:1,4-dihydroxy-2-naphthoate octaprenyltransferase
MKTRKEPRVAGTNSGAQAVKAKTIVTNRRMKNKLHNAILRGTYLGAILALMACCLYVEVDPIVGCLTGVIPAMYCGLFYGLNHNDRMFGGTR